MILYSTQRGIALVAVLIFIEIFSVLGLFALQSNLQENKLTHRIWAKSIMRSAAEAKLSALENKLTQIMPSCHIPETPAPILVSNTLAWWRAISCVGIFRLFQYYYVIEFLGNDACAYLQSFDENSEASVSYYRVSLLMMSNTDSGARLILQSTIVRPATRGETCREYRHRVTPGRQMLRELM
jgi:hypothetical protein